MHITKLRAAAVGVLSAAIFAVCVLAIGACGSSEDAGASTTRAEARTYVVDHIRGRLYGTTRLAPLYRSARDLLSNVRYAAGNGPGAPLTDAVVVGTVRDVSPGYGFAVPSSPAEEALPGDGVEVAFDSPDALWRTVHLTIDVEQVLSGDVAPDTRQVAVGLAIGNGTVDDRRLEEGIMALGKTVWFLRSGSPVFSYDPSLYSDVEDGALIAEVAPDGRLSFPMLDPDGASAALLGRPTLAQLRDAADAPARIVRLHREGGTWVR